MKTERLVKSLSWSKIYSWLNNRKQFEKTYFEGEPFFETKEILFGSCLGKMLELKEYENEDLIVNECLKNWDGEIVEDKRKEEILRKSFKNIISNSDFIEKLQELEFDLFSEFEKKFQNFVNNVCVLGFADNCSVNLKQIKEFKTGKTAWDEKRVDEHGQLDIYCLLTFLEKGYFPEDIELLWFPTSENENGEIILTGEIKKFKFDIEKNKERILAWKEKIPEIFEEIFQAQVEWEKRKEKENKEEFSENLLFEAYELQKQIDKLTEKQNEIKKQIEEKMVSGNLRDYKVEGIGSVFYTSRKKYNYDENVKNAEENFKNLKKEFEKNNEAEIIESLSFRFSK